MDVEISREHKAEVQLITDYCLDYQNHGDTLYLSSSGHGMKVW